MRHPSIVLVAILFFGGISWACGHPGKPASIGSSRRNGPPVSQESSSRRNGPTVSQESSRKNGPPPPNQATVYAAQQEAEPSGTLSLEEYEDFVENREQSFSSLELENQGGDDWNRYSQSRRPMLTTRVKSAESNQQPIPDASCLPGPIELGRAFLNRAEDREKSGANIDALELYQLGLDTWIEAIKNAGFRGTDPKQANLKAEFEVYINRAETLKQQMLREQPTIQIKIADGSIGYSYATLFGGFFDSSVRTIDIDDPYIRLPHQCDNLARFVDICIQKCTNLKTIKLKTGKERSEEAFREQDGRLRTLARSVLYAHPRKIHLKIEYDDVLHDREIRIGNGWTFHIGYGLDYFQKVNRYTLASVNPDLRICKETTVNIQYQPNQNY